MNNTIWIVDDTADIFYAFIPAMAKQSRYRVEYVSHVKSLQAKPGDIIFLDLIGTGSSRFVPPAGTTVLSMTGSNKKADLRKPFTEAELMALLDSMLNPKKDLKAA